MREKIRLKQGEKVLACPMCDFECVHPVLVSVNSGGIITSVVRDGTITHKGEPSGRGVAIELIFACEHGHRWMSILQFHKGDTLLKTISLGEFDLSDGIGTIWRD